MRDRRAVLLLAVIACVAPVAASAEITAENFNVHVSLTSDYVYRGVSQSDERAAIQGVFELELDLGIYTGIWASSVDIPSIDPEADPRTLELDYYAGFRFGLGPNWSGDVLLIRYTYPGATIHYDYSEIGFSLQYLNLVSGAISYSNDAYGFEIRGLSYDLTARLPLSRGFELQGGVGYYDLDAPWIESYFYWGFGVSKEVLDFILDLSYIDTDSAAERFFGDRAGSRVALTLSAEIH